MTSPERSLLVRVASRARSKARHARMRLGPPSITDVFNLPVKMIEGSLAVNERIVEIPYVLRHLSVEAGGNATILDFGGTKSYLSHQLACCGFDVTNIDLRAYPMEHPSLTSVHGDILQWQPAHTFDVIVSISVLEHIGLGAYGETANGDEMLHGVCERLHDLLSPGGRLLVTTPVGRRSIDPFERSFGVGDVESLFSGLKLVDATYYRRADRTTWVPADAEVVARIDNSVDSRGPTGVNAVGCFAFDAPPAA